MSSLKNDTINGVKWNFIDTLSSSGITFLISVILARMLSPRDFGIVGMVAVFHTISYSITDFGFGNALIRKTEAKQVDYSTAFYINLINGLFFYLMVYFCSPLISQFFREPIIIPILKVYGLIFIVDSIAVIQRIILIKKIDFKTQAKVSLIASILSGIIGISMAYFECGVWSLVGQLLSRQAFISLFLWIYSSWRPTWEFSKKSFKELFGFGSKIMITELINTIFKNIEYLVIGRFYGSNQLGQYTQAGKLNNIFAKNMLAVIQKVTYPVLSSIKEDSIRLKSAYQKTIKTTLIISSVCLLGMAAVSKPLVLLLYGNQWLTAVFYLQIICFSGVLYPLNAINANVLWVKGRSDIYLKLEIIKKIFYAIPIFLGIFLGIEAMLWGLVLNSIIAYCFTIHYSSKLINYSIKEQINDIWLIIIVSLVVSGCIWSLNLVGIQNNLLLITLQMIVGSLIFILINEKLKIKEYFEIKRLFMQVLKKTNIDFVLNKINRKTNE